MIAQKAKVRGRFKIEHRDRDGKLLGVYDIPNGITTPGMNYLLEAGFHSGTPITTWYIGLIDNASFSALADADTMASHAGWLEAVPYSDSTRRQWTCGAASARAITNGTTVDFTINATATLKGIFIASDSTKSGTGGTLWSTAAFGSNVSVANGDTLKVTYTVSG